MTENTDSPHPAPVEVNPSNAGAALPPGAAHITLAHPATGELLELGAAPAWRLFDELDAIRDLEARLGDFRRTVEDELARRADQLNARTVTLDGCDWTVNAPTQDVYSVGAILSEARKYRNRAAELAATSALGNYDAGVTLNRDRAGLLESLVVTPPPSQPEPRVDARAVARLLKTDDREILAALAAARERRPTRRTVKLKARAINAGAREE